jgi:hypothetical protein
MPQQLRTQTTLVELYKFVESTIIQFPPTFPAELPESRLKAPANGPKKCFIEKLLAHRN